MKSTDTNSTKMEIDWVKSKLYKWRYLRNKTKESLERTIVHCFELGYTKEDVVAYIKLTEEYNPLLSEETALAAMRKIHAKYRSIHAKLDKVSCNKS